MSVMNPAAPISEVDRDFIVKVDHHERLRANKPSTDALCVDRRQDKASFGTSDLQTRVSTLDPAPKMRNPARTRANGLISCHSAETHNVDSATSTTALVTTCSTSSSNLRQPPIAVVLRFQILITKTPSAIKASIQTKHTHWKIKLSGRPLGPPAAYIAV